MGARLISDALVTAAAQRLVLVDPPTLPSEAMCTVPVEMLTAVPTLVKGAGIVGFSRSRRGSA